jgi:hypothetical protein
MPFKPGQSGNPGGKPKGAKRKTTFDKELLRQELRDIVRAHLAPMTEAQVSNAKGIKYLVTREKKTGKFTRVEDIRGKITAQDGEEIIEVWEKDPSVQAFTDLMNRTIDKPADTLNNEQSGTITHIYKWGGE